MTSDAQITIVLPFRLTARDAYRLDRLGWVDLDPSRADHAKVLVVDDGSEPELAHALADKCAHLGYDYLHIPTSARLFSVGRCRNAGAQTATTPYVFFMDVDLMAPPGFAATLAQQIEIQNLQAGAEKFLMTPVIYLTQAESELAEDRYSSSYFGTLKDATLARDETRVEKYSPGTSACLYNRHMFLAAGGNDEVFEGWGFEDFDFNCRLLRHSGQLPLPTNFGKNKGNFDQQYLFEGFRAVYRLLGDRSAFHGLMLYHIWHPIEQTSDYQKKNLANRRLFEQSAAFGGARPPPAPLPDLSQGRTLVVGESVLADAPKLRPLLGEIVLFDENATLAEEMAKHEITRIFFDATFADGFDAGLYEQARLEGLTCLVAKRGDQPGSILLTENGVSREGEDCSFVDGLLPADVPPQTPNFTRLRLGEMDIAFVTGEDAEFDITSPLFDRYRESAERLKPVGEEDRQLVALLHKASLDDTTLRDRYGLQIYRLFIWPFLTPMERERLTLSPHRFFVEGKHWTTRVGAWALGIDGSAGT